MRHSTKRLLHLLGTALTVSLVPHFSVGLAPPAWADGSPPDGSSSSTPPASDASCPPDVPSSLGLAPLDPVDTSTAGWTPGSFAVTSSGEATYTIPLTVPPGRAGMVPSLAITYSSGGGEGPLGRGFSLTGLSRVARCIKNFELDGEAHAVAYDDTDAYCLDGQRLLLVSDQGDTKEYRTIPDTHARVLSVHTGDVEGPTYFEVDEPSGIRKWYGTTGDSRAMARTGHVAGWALSEVSDRHANGIQYEYVNVTGISEEPHQDGSTQTVTYTREQYLTAIRYTSPNPQRSIELAYDTRPSRHSFHGQMDLMQSRRLTSIAMYGPDHELVRDYSLTYEGTGLPSSRLAKVEECTYGWDGQSYGRRCLAPTRFEWSGTAADGGFARVATPIHVSDDTAWVMADVSGDGLDDVVLSDHLGASVFSVALGTGDPAQPFQDPAVWFMTAPPPGVNWRYELLPADIDNDGRMDLVLHLEQDESPYVRWLRSSPPNAQSPLPHFELVTTSIPREPNNDEVNQLLAGENGLKLGDFDGDGAADVLRCQRNLTLVTTIAAWQPGQDFDLQVGDGLYLRNDEMILYRNEGGGTFAGGISAFATDCERAGRMPVAPVFGEGKATVLNDGYTVFSVMVPGMGGTIDVHSDTTFSAMWQPGAGSPFVSVPTRLQVRNDLPVMGVDGVAHKDEVPVDQSRRPVIADFNGDGITDAMVLGRELRDCEDGEDGRGPSDDLACWDTHAVVTFGQSPISGYSDQSSIGQSGETPLPAPRSIVKTLVDQAIAFHYDDDDMADVLFPLHGSCSTDPGTTCYAVLRSTGDVAAPFDIVPTGVPYRWETSPGEYETPRGGAAQPADTDGDGRADLVVLEHTNDLAVYRRAAPARRVTRIIEGRNPRTADDPKFVPSVEIEYGPLVDRRQTNADLVAFGDEDVANTQTGPTSDDLYRARWRSQTCAWPVACVAGGRQVVSRYRVPDGLDGQRSVALLYRDGRYDVSGHRWLGFGAVLRVDLDTLAGSATFMNNEQYDTTLKVYPFAAVPSSTWEWKPALSGQPDGHQLELTFGGTTHVVVPTVAGSYFRYAGFSRVWTDEAVFDPSHGFYQLIDKVEQESISPTNVLTDEMRTVTDVDSFGNVLAEQTQTEGVLEVESAAHTYDNDTTSWILGRERHRKACSTVGPVTQCREQWHWYDDHGQLEHTRVGDPSDPTTVLDSWYTRDTRGNVVGTVLVDGLGEKRSTCSTYDPEGVFVLRTNNSESLERRAEYDRGLGVKLAEQDANGLITRWAVDGFGRVRRQINPDGTKTWSSLTQEPGCGSDGLALCTVLTTETTSGTWQQTISDSLGRMVRTLTAGPDAATCTESGVCEKGATIAIDQEYDHLGRLVRISRPYILGDTLTPKHHEEIEYDALGREVRRSQPNGLTVETTYDGLTTTRWDGWGGTVTTHDGKRRIASVLDAFQTETTYTYGPFGLTSDVQIDGQPAETTTSIYDAYGRLIEHHDPDQGTTTTVFNGYGEPAHITDSLARTVSLMRDGIGRVTFREDPDGTAIYEYDTAANGKGKLASERLVVQGTTVNEQSYAYDPHGRIAGMTVQRGNGLFVTDVSYDARGLPSELSYPDDGSGARFKVLSTYDSRGNLEAVDGLRLGKGAVPAGYQRLWELEEVHTTGRTRLESFDNGVATSTRVDATTGAVTEIETTSPAQPEAVQDLGYHYDTRGNLEWRHDALQGAPGSGGVTEWFHHDALGRLGCTRVAEGDVEPQGSCALDLHYGANGNIESKSDVGNYQYDDPAHPHAVTATTGVPGAAHEYTYDAVGNQRTRDLDGVTYTARNKPLTYDLSGGGTVSFEYTARGERLRKVSSETHTETIWIGNIYERRTDQQTGAIEHRFHVFGRDRIVVDVVRATSQPGIPVEDAAEYQHVDHLGSLDAVTDDSGAVTTRASFDAFGRRRDPAWLSTTPVSGPPPAMGFTGQEEDHEIGVIDMRARLYDPVLGRFLNVDPHVTNPLSAQSWNGYSYVRNRPTVFVDPTGMDDVSIGGWSFTLPSTGSELVDKLVADAANGVGAVIDYVAGDGSVPVQKVAAAEDVASEVTSYPGGVDERAAGAQLAGLMFQEGVGDALHGMGFGAIRTMAQIAAPTTAGTLGMGSPFDPHPAPELTGNAWADLALNTVPLTRIAGGFFRTGVALGSGDPYAAGYTIVSPAVEVALLAAGLGAAEGNACAGGICEASCFVAGTPIITASGERPIEAVHVGERVRTLGDEACAEPVDTAALRRIVIRMPNPDREGDVVRITTLRSVDWIRRHAVHEGRRVYLTLDELGYRGYGRVDDISSDVAISSGPGCVVLSTFSHASGTVRTLRFRGLEEVIHGTSLHPFYSLERRSWVAAGDLTVGERVKTLDGESTVELNAGLPGVHQVYNLEVAKTHTYLVGHGALWVHNSCFDAATGAAARTFWSRDPLVADLANRIEAAYPGHVVGVNVPLWNAGKLVTDLDILLKNAVIQVKSGPGKGLTTQLANTQAATHLPVIGYGPDLGGSLVKGIQAAGGLVTTDEQLLIQVVAP